MRRLTRLTGGAVAAAVLVLVTPLPASAGGPTSVILVSPGRQVTASLYTTDEAYSRLDRLVGPSPAADPAAPDLRGGPGSDAINVTWLIHDVQVWRVDRIFTDAPGGPWIETNLMDVGTGGGVALDKPGVMHRPSDGKELVALLSALRLLGDSPPGAFQGAKAPAVADQPAVDRQAAATPAEPRVAQLDWLWLLVGGAAGMILAVGFRPLVRRLRPN
jgi:hypothetical protein